MKNDSGTYVITLKCCVEESLIPIGKKKNLLLERGYYYYVGSAFGPGGVKARVSHHQNISENPRWHLDFLRKHTKIIEIWHTYDNNKREHQWANILCQNPFTNIPLYGFGATDCKCFSHLFFSKKMITHALFLRLIKNKFPEHGAIYCDTP